VEIHLADIRGGAYARALNRYVLEGDSTIGGSRNVKLGHDDLGRVRRNGRGLRRIRSQRDAQARTGTRSGTDTGRTGGRSGQSSFVTGDFATRGRHRNGRRGGNNVVPVKAVRNERGFIRD